MHPRAQNRSSDRDGTFLIPARPSQVLVYSGHYASELPSVPGGVAREVCAQPLPQPTLLLWCRVVHAAIMIARLSLCHFLRA